MSAPAFGTLGALHNATTSTPAFGVPASVASGDIIVVAFFADVSTTTISAFPTGFAAAENSPRTVNSGGVSNHVVHVAWKRASGADSGTYSFTLSASVFVYGNAVRFTGCVAAGNPWDSPTAAGDGGSTGSTTTPDIAVTTLGPDRLLFFVGDNVSGDGGTWTAPSGFTEREGGVNRTNIEISDKVQAAQGGSGNLHATNTASDKVGDWLGALIGTTVAGSVPPPPTRTVQGRDFGEVQWLQRDRRDANTVATAANPVVTPLDSAWQAGAQYWHLYCDVSDSAPRTWQSLQRNYISDPSTFASLTDPLTLAAGVGGDTWRRYSMPDYMDRREVPQQPQRDSQPLMLDTAELENELLGGAETVKRYVLPATHVDRREVPQQRLYVSDPSLLTTAQLENELLGGAETALRVNVPVTHAPRWWMPQQPERETLYFDAGPDSPPLTLAWGSGGVYRMTYNQAGWQPDRREVPQQRVYISDPSFYPTVAPVDPLTVAWGVGGRYWLLYNEAALYADRREVPQQRRYVSDPTTLASALLENELLGGADDRWRRLQAFTERREVPQQRSSNPVPADVLTDPLTLAAGVGGDTWRRYNLPSYADRREVPQQRAYASEQSLFALDADPLILAAGVGGDTWRRYNLPSYADRREVPQQPARLTLYFDAGPGLMPLTVAWGSGGDNWHRGQWRRPARSWWPPRLLFIPLGDPCTITRPTLGTTSRSSGGTTTRPNTGITEDPC